jgi:shikimate dehydrogenase
MFVLSIEGTDLEKALPRVAAFTGVFDILEVRLGDRPLSTKDQAFLKALDVRLCYTVPPNYPFLTASWTSPPYLIDVPWQTSSDTLATIRSLYPNAILQGSAHDYPLPVAQLFTQIHERGFDAIKIANTVHSTKETVDLLAFLKEHSQSVRLTVVPMGEAGQFGRLLALTLNSFLGFCCLPGSPTAPGQLDIATMHSLYHAKDLSSQTVRYALIGEHVQKSPSHRTHTNVLRHFEIDGVYVKIPVSQEELLQTLPILESLGFAGLSVTTPLKEICGSESFPVNTLKWSAGTMTRTNTDAPALVDALQEHTPLSGARVLLLGAGGVGASVLHALRTLGADVSVYNRTHERALALTKRIGGTTVDSGVLHHMNRFDIVVNATSAHFSSSFPQSFSTLPLQKWGVHVAAEFALNTTPFLDIAAKSGVMTVGGEELWARQAAKQFHWWCGIDEDRALLYLREQLQKAPG